MLIKLLTFYWRDAWNARTVIFILSILLLSGILAFIPLDIDTGINTVFSPVNVSIVDDDRSLISHVLISQFSALAVVDNVYAETFEQAMDRLDRNEVLLVMVIPEGFYEQTRFALDRSALTVHLNAQMPAETSMFVRILNNASAGVVGIQSALYAYQEAITPLYTDQDNFFSAVEVAAINLAFKLMDRGSIVRIDTSSNHNPTAHVIGTLICLLTMMTSLLGFMQIQQERRDGLHERLILANVRWWQSTAARIVSGLFWLAAGLAPVFVLLHHFYPVLPFGLIGIIVLLLHLSTAALSTILAYMGKISDLLLPAAWLGILALLLLGGCIYPWPLLPGWIRTAGQLLPSYWAHSALYSLLAGQPLRQGTLFYLALFPAVIIPLSGPAFKRARPGRA